MKKLVSALLIPLLLLALTACGKPAAIPNPPLVLGEKYLLDLDYEQALLQFDQAIKIEPKNPRGYLGRADALLHLDRQAEAASALADGTKAARGDAREALRSAQAGVEKTPVDGYIGLSSAYEKLGWREIALALLRRVCGELPGESRLREALEGLIERPGQEELTKGDDTEETTTTAAPKKPVKRAIDYGPDGTVLNTTIYKYDADGKSVGYEGQHHNVKATYNDKGQVIREDMENDDGGSWYQTHQYNEKGQAIQTDMYESNGTSVHSTNEYNTAGQCIRSESHVSTGRSDYYTYEYNDAGQRIREDWHNSDGESGYETYERNSEGLLIRKNTYQEGKLFYYTIYEY